MGIFSNLLTKKLTPSWEYRTEGLLWRLLPGAGFLVGEDRPIDRQAVDNKTRRVSFFCIEQETGNVRWKDIGFDEAWWIGIEAIHRDVVLLHEFARPDMPDHKKVIALDAASGRTLWSNDQYRFMFVHDDSVYVSKDLFEGRLYVELDLRTGEFVREFKDQPDYINVLRETAAARTVSDVEFPKTLSAEHEELAANKTIARLLASLQRYGDIEILVKERYAIVGHYRAAGSAQENLEQYLQVIDTEANSVVFEDMLARDAKAPVSDTFFARDDMLMYVKEKNTLTAVRLP